MGIYFCGERNLGAIPVILMSPLGDLSQKQESFEGFKLWKTFRTPEIVDPIPHYAQGWNDHNTIEVLAVFTKDGTQDQKHSASRFQKSPMQPHLPNT